MTSRDHGAADLNAARRALDDTALRTRERCPVCDRPALLTWSDSAGGESVCRGGHEEPEDYTPGARVVPTGGGR